jgi:hypothetical protein
MIVIDFDGQWGRRKGIDPFHNETQRNEFREMVTVSQDVDLTTFKWKEAKVNWSCVGQVTPMDAESFGDAVKHAAAVARDWTSERLGKPANKV